MRLTGLNFVTEDFTFQIADPTFQNQKPQHNYLPTTKMPNIFIIKEAFGSSRSQETLAGYENNHTSELIPKWSSKNMSIIDQLLQ